MRVKAAVYAEADAPLRFEELTLDEPRADEVQVRFVATGVCHTDTAMRTGRFPVRAPAVLGHEGAGIVERVGAAVTHVSPGDHVVLGPASCGTCAQCSHGHPMSCVEFPARNFLARRPDGSVAFQDARAQPVGSHFFGQSSFAEVSNVAGRSVVKVPDDLPLEILGPLGCGIQTGAGAVMNVLQPRPGGSFAVFGAGAVGMAALLAAVAGRVGTIIAVDVVASRLTLARELGATHVIDASAEDAVERMQQITGSGVQTALDTTGNAAVFRQMVDVLGPSGHAGAVAIAAPGAEGVVDLGAALRRGIRISWIVEGDAVPQTFIPELIALYRAGQFPFDRLITTYPFAEIERAFEDSERGTALKPVVVY